MSQDVYTKIRTTVMRQCDTVFWRWLCVLVYASAIFVLSAVPGNKLPAFHVSDKVLHAVEFGILAFLLCRALHAQMPARSERFIMGCSLLIAIGYGISDEAHQLLVAERVSDLTDLMADSLGAFCAVWMWSRVRKYWLWLQ
jgi:VanZ family protein